MSRSSNSSNSSLVVVVVIFAIAVCSIIFMNFPGDSQPNPKSSSETDKFRHNSSESVLAGVVEVDQHDSIQYSNSNNLERKSIIDCENMVPLELQSPRFLGSIPNVTVSKGDNVSMTCVVENLGIYRMAWMKLQSQTILAIHDHIITKNRRISASLDTQKWETPCKNRNVESNITMYTIHINHVGMNDQGHYMCQINVDPMKGQWGYLRVLEPLFDSSDSITNGDEGS